MKLYRLKYLSFATATVVALSAATPAIAGSIGVNVGPNGPDDPQDNRSAINNELPSDTSAGIFPQTNWNNLMGNGVPATQLMDDSGTLLATTATISTQWTNGVQDHGLDDGDQILMNGGLDGGNNTTLSSTVTGIPYASYDVYIYFDGGNDNGRGGIYAATPSGAGASDAQSQDGYDLASFSGTYIQAIGNGLDDEDNPTAANFVKFTGMSGENLEITSFPLPHPSNVNRAPWNGFQIVESGSDAAPIEITAYDYSPDDNTISLTWTSDPDQFYIVRFSRDVADFTGGMDGDLDDGIEGDDGPTTTREYDLSSVGLEDEPRLFFQVVQQ